MSIHDYWAMYDRTLARIRDEKPDTFDALKAILDRFHPPSSGDAFFPGGADDTLADALRNAGWHVDFQEGDYLWTAWHPLTGASIRHVEGDIYTARGRWASQPMVQTLPTTSATDADAAADAAPNAKEQDR